jgi:hypothetical protein
MQGNAESEKPGINKAEIFAYHVLVMIHGVPALHLTPSRQRAEYTLEQPTTPRMNPA